ncbi:hypothetical protein [Krasilnikovia sp. MM14-A1259]|uniref:hypothetical protein n=1 Tax=Krasilnikovia sp. MM14-A1259 TaxID=3373539 RepID=UPI00382D8A5F
MDLADRRSAARETPPPPDWHRDETAQEVGADSGRQSGPGITLSDIPGDWDSVRAIWTGTPEPLSALAGQVRAARGSEDPRQVAMACWSLLVLIPRVVLHGASWFLQHPARTAAALLVLGVLIGSLTL